MRTRLLMTALALGLVFPAAAQDPVAVRAKQLERFSKMSPEDREKALSKLPPERRARIERQLERYQNLTPEQRDRVNQRLGMLESLPADRQRALRQELRYLRGLRPADRRVILNSEQERKRFSEEELRLLRESLGREPARILSK